LASLEAETFLWRRNYKKASKFLSKPFRVPRVGLVFRYKTTTRAFTPQYLSIGCFAFKQAGQRLHTDRTS